MRVCFVVNSPRTQKATYTTLHLAFSAHRRGHDVALASAMTSILARPDRGRGLGEAGRRKVEGEFRAAAMVGRIESLYEVALERKVRAA
jgi:glycosyltransferase involved in cell wall biosynthesis